MSTEKKQDEFFLLVKSVFEKEIVPVVQMDGGDIVLVAADGETGVVQVKLQGACVGCPLSAVTLNLGVERTLLDRVPGFTELIVDEGEYED